MSTSIYLFIYQYSNPSKRGLLADTAVLQILPEFSDMVTHLQGFYFLTLKSFMKTLMQLAYNVLLSTGMLIGPYLLIFIIARYMYK